MENWSRKNPIPQIRTDSSSSDGKQMSSSAPNHESEHHRDDGVRRSVSQEDLREEPNEDVENVVDDREEIPQGINFFSVKSKLFECNSQENETNFRKFFIAF